MKINFKILMRQNINKTYKYLKNIKSLLRHTFLNYPASVVISFVKYGWTGF